MEDSFTKRKINPDTWVIEGPGCYSYLLPGSERVLMIDSGMSKQDLKAYAGTITHLPFMGVLNTHGHFDHTGGNGWFGKAYMHPLAAEQAKTPFKGMEGFNLDYEIETLADGQKIELGNRALEILYIGAHNPGSVAVLDTSSRLLFTGDELEAGQVLLVPSDDGSPRTQTVENFVKQIKKLYAHIHSFDYICPSHGGTPVDKSYIDYFTEAGEMILEASAKGAFIGEDLKEKNQWKWLYNGYLRRFEHKGAGIVYDVRAVKD